MDMFRRLMTMVLLAGTIAGLALAALQSVTVVPLILAAEAYEHAAPPSPAHAAHDAPGAARETAGEAAEWQPSDGLERTAYTILGTVLTGIAFAALLFGAWSLAGRDLDLRRGLWLGLAGFACFALAPAIGLPPKPPGVPGADVQTAQIWWSATALATALGLAALARPRTPWSWRIAALALLLAPHLVGAPQPVGETTVPAALIRQFAIVSVATQGAFWLLLGGLGGLIHPRILGGAAAPRGAARAAGGPSGPRPAIP